MVPAVNLPGCALAAAMTSSSWLKRDEAATKTPRSKKASVLIGAKSRVTSNGSFLKSDALSALLLLIKSKV